MKRLFTVRKIIERVRIPIMILLGITIASCITSAAVAATWSYLPSTPTETGAVGHALVATGSGKIFRFGGVLPYVSRENWMYDTATTTWTRKTDAPAPMEWNGAAYDGNGYVYMNRGNWSNEMYRYDIASDTWASLASAPISLLAYGRAAYDGSGGVVFTGGRNLSSMLRYDISSNAWEDLGPMPVRMMYNNVIADGTGNLYINESYSDNTPYSPQFLRYNINSRTWTELTDVPNMLYMNAAYDGNGGILATGVNTTNGNVELYNYNIADNLWTSLGIAPDTGLQCAGAFQDGTYYVAGQGNQFLSYGPITPPTAVPEPPAIVAACIMLMPFGIRKLKSMYK